MKKDFGDATYKPDLNYVLSAEQFEKTYPEISEDHLKQWYMLAHEIARAYSKDPSTKVCALLISPNNELISIGINNFNEGVKATEERLNDRAYKYPLSLHAERGALTACAREGVSSKGGILITSLFPCETCTSITVGSGVSTFVTDAKQLTPEILERWGDSFKFTEIIMKEATPHTDISDKLIVTLIDLKASDELILSTEKILKIEGLVNGHAFKTPISFSKLKSGNYRKPSPNKKLQS